MRKFFENRAATFRSIMKVREYLTENLAEFKDLSPGAQLDLSMKFFQCEKGRMQKFNMPINWVFRLAPLVTALAALILALQR